MAQMNSARAVERWQLTVDELNLSWWGWEGLAETVRLPSWKLMKKLGPGSGSSECLAAGERLKRRLEGLHLWH